MSDTQATLGVLESTAKKFEETDASLSKTLSDLLNRLEPLQTKFVGGGGRSFTDVKISWSQAQQRLHDALRQTAEAIRTSGKAYETSDSQTQQRFTGVNQVPTLPL